MPDQDLLPNELITIYLEMTTITEFNRAFLTPAEASTVTLMQMAIADVDFYRFLYDAVGRKWRWRDRLLLDEEQLRRILAADTNRIEVLYVEGCPAGYVELQKSGNAVEIAYFGLRSQFFGRGFGKHLLSHGIQEAWAWGTERVWLHTCNLDGPHALANYLKRGFRVYNESREPMPTHYQ